MTDGTLYFWVLRTSNTRFEGYHFMLTIFHRKVCHRPYSAADQGPKNLIPQAAVPHFLTYTKFTSGVSSLQNCKLEVSTPLASWENLHLVGAPTSR